MNNNTLLTSAKHTPGVRSGRTVAKCAAIAALLTLAVAGCSHNESKPATAPAPPSTPVASTAPSTVFVPRVASNKSELQKADGNGMVQVPVSLAPSATPEKEALSKLADEANSPLPKGTRILSVSVDNQGLATADFSSEFQKNFSGSDTEEAQAITSVLTTLGQFPNVQNVQFMVDGQKIAQLGGTQDLSDPLPVVRRAQTAGADSTVDNTSANSASTATENIAMGGSAR